MRRAIVLLVAICLIVPTLAMAGSGKKDEWSVGGIVEMTKVYPADESHGYTMRIDVKRPNGKIKKVFCKADTKFVDGAGKAKSGGDVKTGKPIQIKYKKGSGDDFIAFEVLIL